MKQYRIIYEDKSIEYIEAYGCRRHGKQVTFDMGHRKTYVVNNVKQVEELWDEKKGGEE